jgi:hypothetical protein
LNERLSSQIDELLAVFFAYSRSESKIDEKEIVYQSEIEEGKRQIQDAQKVIAEIQAANKEFKDKIA